MSKIYVRVQFQRLQNLRRGHTEKGRVTCRGSAFSDVGQGFGHDTG